VSSSDGGGSAGHGRPADRSTEGDGRPAAGRAPDAVPEEHDPVRLSPPADPWLAEAPTSAVGDAPTLRDPAAGQVPLADTARFDDQGPFDSPPRPPGRRGRRATRWVLAVLAVGALFIAGMLAMDQFGSGDGDGDALRSGPSPGASRGTVPAATRTPSRQEPTSTSAASVAPAGNPAADPAGGQPSAATSDRPDGSADGPVAVYEVTASGSDNTGSVSYTDQDGDIIRLSGIALPWRLTFPVGAQRQPLVLISQRQGGGDAGPVTCTITLNGKVLSSTTARGRYAAPECSG
jgi:hypothetical protein